MELLPEETVKMEESQGRKGCQAKRWFQSKVPQRGASVWSHYELWSLSLYLCNCKLDVKRKENMCSSVLISSFIAGFVICRFFFLGLWVYQFHWYFQRNNFLFFGFFCCFLYSSSFSFPAVFIISLFLHALNLVGFLKRGYVNLIISLCQKWISKVKMHLSRPN